MLRAGGIRVDDWPPPLCFALPDHARMARAFEPYISTLMPDAEAWAALFTDEDRLATYRAVYGNQKGRVSARTSPQQTLAWPEAEVDVCVAERFL